MALNLYAEFCKSAVKYPDHIFVHQCDDGGYQKYSYRQIHEDADILSSYLWERNLKRGDRVAILSENRFESIVAYIASVALGLVVVPLDPKWTALDWAGPLNHAEVQLLFVSENLLQKIKALLPEIPSLRHIIVYHPTGDIPGAVSLRNLLHGRSTRRSRPDPGNIDPDHTAAIIYTSGTTGRSKGVMLTHENLLRSAQIVKGVHGCEGEIAATILPLNHIFALSTCAWVGLIGMSIVLFPKLDPDVVDRALRDIRPHYFVTVPLFLERVAANIEHHLTLCHLGRLNGWIRRAAGGHLGTQSDRFGFLKKVLFYKVQQKLGGRLKSFVCGGAPLDPQLLRFFNALGVKVLEGYGLTETTSVVSVNRGRHCRVGSVGKALGQIHTSIDRPDSEGIGEICVRGPVVMKGYYKDREETQKALDPDGWFHTGDLGRLDKDGFLFITGRKKDLIVTSNGKNVYPEEIEEFFSKMPWVKEVCVFGVGRNPTAGSPQEVIHLQIVPDFDRAREDGIQDLHSAVRKEVRTVSDLLPDYKRPRSIGFSKDVFPRTSTLKVKKNLVKEAFLTENRSEEKKHVPQASDRQFDGPVGASVVNLLQRLSAEEVDLLPDSSLSMDLSLDSLTILEFWSHLEKVFHVSLSEKARSELKTVRQVIQHLEASPSVNTERLQGEVELEIEKDEYQSWDEILGVESEENRNRVRTVLAKYRRARPLCLAALHYFFTRFSHLELRGLEHLPEKGPFILAPNHESHLDNLFVACQLPRRVQENMVVIAKREHFEKRATRTVAELCHGIPVDRENVSAATLQMCADVLREGKILLAHPEGTRSPDGNLLPLKPGVAILAKHLNCPVVPVYIEGAHEFWPKDSVLPRSRSRITVTIGEPLHPIPAEQGVGRENASCLVEQLTQRMMVSLTAMSQESCKKGSGAFL